MIHKGDLIKKVGFYQTLQILSIKGGWMRLREFYEILVKESYYNAFIRIRKEMENKGLIIINYDTSNIFKMIKLTKKGILVKQTIKALMELIK